ncbi:MAG: 50S ribosomal protein L30 [Fibromonadaceae bacterium]|jgi:large subunit ribosomal protein L30|nr:50S ribosomal protein L30 [Fibromonadaceae bacterium]
MSKEAKNQKIITEQLNAINTLRGKKIAVKQTVSAIRSLPVHKVNLKSLGLTRIGKTKEHLLNPQIEGMLRKVIHMIKISEVS